MKDVAKQFAKAVHRLQGNILWGIAAGRGTGSHVSLHFGERLPRRRPLSNSALSAELREYEGEYCLFVQGARWMVVHGEEEVCCSFSNHLPGGEMLDGLEKLRGLIVNAVAIDADGSSLELVFSEEFKFVVAPSAMFDDVHEDRFSFFTDKEVYFVDSEGRLGMEHRSP